MSDKHGRVWWTELVTSDVPAAREYYGKTCGWSFETMPMPEGEYHLGMIGEQPVAGITAATDMPEGLDRSARWISYMAVDDVDAATKATKDAGGTILRDPFDVPGTGRIVLVQDPTGAEIGLMTPEDMPEDAA